MPQQGGVLEALKENIHASFHCREGVATVIHESAKQLPGKPGMVVVSVGGGGLLSGVLQGMHDVGWTDVPLVAMETKGAHSFDAAIQAGELVTLDAITRWVSEIDSCDLNKVSLTTLTYWLVGLNFQREK